MSCVGDLKGRLVSGTFRVMSGSDFKGRRSKAQMVVEQGPQKTGFANYEKMVVFVWICWDSDLYIVLVLYGIRYNIQSTH